MKIYRLSALPFHEQWYEENNPIATLDFSKTVDRVDTSLRQGLDPMSHEIQDEFHANDPATLSELIEKMFPNASALGIGGLGVVYDLQDGRVLKITSHRSEATSAAHLKDKNLKHLVDIYDIIYLSKGYWNSSSVVLWGIITKLVQPIDVHSEEASLINNMILYHKYDNPNPIDIKSYKDKTSIPEQRIYHIIKEIKELFEEFKYNNLDTFDVVSQNLGWDGNTLVQLDLGFLADKLED